jgi:hypothetical protein
MGIALVVTILGTPSFAKHFVVLGSGNTGCSSWTRERNLAAGNWGGMGGWIDGYLSAVNEFVWPSANISEGKSTDQLFSFVDKFCRMHPQNTVVDAAVALRDSLALGATRNKR